MKLTIKWASGEQRTLENVLGFTKSWHHDEWVLSVDYTDGTDDTYTGKQMSVSGGSTPQGRHQNPRRYHDE